MGLALLAKILGKLDVLLEVGIGHGRANRLQALDEIGEAELRFGEVIPVDVGPAHFTGIGVPGGARCKVLTELTGFAIRHHHLHAHAQREKDETVNLLCYGFKVGGSLDFAHWLHQGVPGHGADIRTAVMIRNLGKVLEIGGF